MTTGFSDVEAQPANDEGACLAGASTADVLRLLSAGASGAILMALGEGALRTMELTERVPGYSPRTIYRHAGKLAALEVLDREEEPGVPSKVVHTLTDDCGTELYRLVSRFAGASMTRLPNGDVDAHAWAALSLLADLWETGMVAELSCDALSSIELARGPHGLSYHQVHRRAGLFKAAGLLSNLDGGRRYVLTNKTRKKMGLIVGLGRWRHHHVIAEDEEGLTVEEMATALRTALPLVQVDGHSERCLKLSVLGEDEAGGGEGEAVWINVAGDGTLHGCLESTDGEDAWARGRVGCWIAAMLDGDPRQVLVGGDEQLVGDVLTRLHEVLWTPSPF